jgi:hypothetical protein
LTQNPFMRIMRGEKQSSFDSLHIMLRLPYDTSALRDDIRTLRAGLASSSPILPMRHTRDRTVVGFARQAQDG